MRPSTDVIEIIRKTALDAVVAADENGVIVAVNETACEIFDLPEQALVGRPIGDTIVPHAMRDAHAAGMARYQRTGEPHVVGKRIEIEALRADGDTFPVELAITEIIEDGRRFFVSYIRDISERRAQQAIIEQARDDAERAVETQSQLIAMLSHDLRTPLNGISTSLDIALTTEDQSEMRRATTMAQRAAAHARVLMEDLLSYTQLEAGALALNPTPTTLTRFRNDIEDRWRSPFESKGLSFTVEMRPDRRNFVLMDSLRVNQIIDNVIANALKYTEEGGAEVRLNWGGPSTVEIEISDSGCGLGEFKCDTALQAFKRGRDGGGGVGLGLWIAKSLVDLHGGTIALTPRLGGGTTARIELPIARASKELALQLKKSCLNDLRVLVVDDNDTNRFVAERMLAKCGSHVEIATNGAEAVARAAEGFDVILMDLDMPIMDGFEATRQIRASDDEKLAATTIIALTAYSTRAHEARIREAGANGLLAKPIQGPDHIAGAICQHLDPERCGGGFTTLQSRAVSTEDEMELVDRTVLQTLADALGADEMRALAFKFSKDVANGVRHIESNTQELDLMELRRASHVLDAVAGTLGAAPLKDLAVELNRACHENNSDRIHGLSSRLIDTANATLLKFEQIWPEYLQ